MFMKEVCECVDLSVESSTPLSTPNCRILFVQFVNFMDHHLAERNKLHQRGIPHRKPVNPRITFIEFPCYILVNAFSSIFKKKRIGKV